MITQLFEALVSRRHNNPRATPTESTSSLGNLVGPFGRSKLCWEAKGTPRDQFQQHLKPQITRSLNDSFGSVPGNDHFTLSLYMIGGSAETAVPTVVFISKSPQSRKDARKAMKESGILSRHPGFGTVYVSKDPGSDNIVPLASGKAPNARIQTGKDATEILYDASRPVSPMGIPIYIGHSSSLRPATANTVRIGGRLFLQTVRHAFRDSPSKVDMTTTMNEDLEIDSDSESEIDYDDEANIAITSIGSRSPDTWSDLASPDSGSSRRLSFNSGTSTPTAAPASQLHATGKTTLDDAAAQLNNAITDLNEATAKLTPFTLTGRRFPLKEPAQPPQESLSPLGRLIEGSTEKDWALIEITDPQIEETLSLLLKHNEPQMLAYDKVALHPKDDAEIFTYTASGGKLCGVLSGTPSSTRLSSGTCFQEVYIVRLDGPLANGDCGSAVIDATTGDTYGHLVAGCRTTGTAYILAAHQIVEEFEKLSMRTMNKEHYTQHISHESPEPSLLHELQEINRRESKPGDTLMVLERHLTRRTSPNYCPFPAKTNILIFGKQTADQYLLLQKACTWKNNAALTTFLDRISVVIREELQKLPRTQRDQIPDFLTTWDLVEAYYSKELKVPQMESCMVVVAQLAHYIGYVWSKN